MPYPFALHERAYEEYIAAYQWYELQEKDPGKRFMLNVEKRLTRISEHPEYYGKRKITTEAQKLTIFRT